MPHPGTSRSDLDPARLRSYLRDRGIKTDSPRLRSLELLAEYAGGSVVASNAGLILFGKDASRSRFVPDARVRCARFRGTTKAEILDHLDIDGTVLDAIADVEAFVARNTRTGGRFTGRMRREDVPEYAPVTVRELLINAIAHTDYALSGSEILVAIFDDRLEIQNPGSFVYGSTVETIKQGISRVRNRAIVRILRELHLMEILGSGYERISTTFDDGYPEPDWRELGVVVRVTIPTHPFFTEGYEGDREGDEGDGEGDGNNEGDRLVDGRSMPLVRNQTLRQLSAHLRRASPSTHRTARVEPSGEDDHKQTPQGRCPPCASGMSASRKRSASPTGSFPGPQLCFKGPAPRGRLSVYPIGGRRGEGFARRCGSRLR